MCFFKDPSSTTYFFSHVIQLLLGNIGRAPRSLENTGQTPAKVTLADLGSPWQIEGPPKLMSLSSSKYSGRVFDRKLEIFPALHAP